MTSHTKRALALLTVSTAFAVSACATSPTGRRQLKLLPSSQMAQMGAQAFTELRQQEPAVASDTQAQRYVECIANRVIQANQNRLGDTKWEVVVFAEDTINAFALPGGKIGVYKGMVDFARNDDQLAAVIGHEIAHVLADHGNERVSTALAAQGLLGTLGAAWGEDSTTRAVVLSGLGLGFDLGVARPHSRTQESEADEVGLTMMARAGFDPSAAVALWQNMGSRGEAPPEFLSTHPSPATRVSQLSALLDRAMPIYEQAVASGQKATCDARFAVK